jgi:hypothetical protein
MPYKDPEVAKTKHREAAKRRREHRRPLDWTDPRGRHGNHSRGERHHRWNHGQIISSHGYIKVRIEKGHHLADSNGYAYEHRVVVEAVLGRRLRPNEVIHHVNHDTTDNRPENLQVLLKGEHSQAPIHPRERDVATGRFVGKKAAGAVLDGREWREFPS